MLSDHLHVIAFCESAFVYKHWREFIVDVAASLVFRLEATIWVSAAPQFFNWADPVLLGFMLVFNFGKLLNIVKRAVDFNVIMNMERFHVIR